MKVDILQDLITIGKLSVHISTLIAWGSGMVGLYGNLHQLVKISRLNESKAKSQALKELAEETYLKVERIAKTSPTQIDDKLLAYMKLAFEAHKEAYNKPPTVKEVKKLVSHAEAMATTDKLRRK